MFAVIYTDGHVDLKALIRECPTDRWVPVLVLRHVPKEGEEENKEDVPPIVPLLSTPETARRFAERNLPKDWPSAVVHLSPAEMDFIRRKGWAIKEYAYPSLVKSIPDTKLDFEVIELAEEPDVIKTYDHRP